MRRLKFRHKYCRVVSISNCKTYICNVGFLSKGIKMFLFLALFLSFYNLHAQKITIIWSGYDNNDVVNVHTHEKYKEHCGEKFGKSKNQK